MAANSTPQHGLYTSTSTRCTFQSPCWHPDSSHPNPYPKLPKLTSSPSASCCPHNPAVSTLHALCPLLLPHPHPQGHVKSAGHGQLPSFWTLAHASALLSLIYNKTFPPSHLGADMSPIYTCHVISLYFPLGKWNSFSVF